MDHNSQQQNTCEYLDTTPSAIRPEETNGIHHPGKDRFRPRLLLPRSDLRQLQRLHRLKQPKREHRRGRCNRHMLLAVNLNLVAFSVHLQDLVGQVFAMFVLTVAAAESAIGLAILVVYSRNRGSIGVEDVNMMKG